MSNFTSKDLYGSMTALVTPMNSSGDVNYSQWQDLIENQVKAGIKAVIVAGTTGESALLSESEYAKLLTDAVKICAGSTTSVIAGTGAIDVNDVIKKNNVAKQLGADAVLCVTPYYLKTTQQGLIKFYQHIADWSELPVILYNVPSRTQNDLLPESTEILSKHKTIIGIKEASTDANRIKQLVDLKLNDFSILSGNDDMFCEAMQNGATGVISVASNVRPRTIIDICTMAALGDFISAKTLNTSLESLYMMLSYQPNPIPVKYLLHESGLINNGIRLPLVWFEGKLPSLKSEINLIKKENTTHE
jgi:4-hydroxy-tetrahydrodipicolinate synthase